MNILTDELPDGIVVGGENIKLNTDFKVIIKAVSMLDNGNTVELFKMLNVVVAEPEKLNKDNLEECIKGIIQFISCDKKNSGKAGKSSGDNTKFYDFEHDAGRIYAAFFQQYNIDLLSTDMHWFLFKALFDNLTEDTLMVKAMQYRTMDISGIKDRKQREFYRKKKDIYKLPVPEENEEYRSLIEEALLNGGDVSKILGGVNNNG